MAGEQKMVFGSTTTVISLTDNMTSTTNTHDAWGAGLTMTQLDNSAGYPLAKAVLNIPGAFNSTPIPAENPRVDLFMLEDDIDSTNDETPDPASGDIEFRAKHVGTFVIDNANVAHRKAIVISLQEARKARFYIRNWTGVQILAGAGITVKITPFTYGAA